MKLILILLSLVLDQIAGPRRTAGGWAWARDFGRWIDSRLTSFSPPVRTLLILAAPIIGLLLVLSLLRGVWVVLWWLASLAVLYLCLGARDLRVRVDDYLRVRAANDDSTAQAIARELTGAPLDVHVTRRDLLAALLVSAHERLFAILFWFIVLGPLGAFVYRIVAELAADDTIGKRTEPGSMSDLHALLAWLPTRLLAFAYGLAGSFIDVLDAWNMRATAGIDQNELVLREAGLAALRYDAAADEDSSPEADRRWVDAAHSLVRRSLAVWLIVCALLTLANWIR